MEGDNCAQAEMGNVDKLGPAPDRLHSVMQTIPMHLRVLMFSASPGIDKGEGVQYSRIVGCRAMPGAGKNTSS